jgi:SAM-dependent methyltransferase
MKEARFDHETQQYYRNNARTLAQRYARARGGIEFWFDAAFPKGSKILDVGAAAGRDVLLLLEDGYDACGVDPCRELVAEGLRANPALKDRLACDALPGLETIADHSFDGILCSAVLMHLPEETLFDAAFGLRRVLKPGGRLLVSLPVDAGGEPVRGRDEKGRLFNGLSPDRLELMLTRLGFSCIGRGENYDSLGREERKWVVQLFVLKTDGAERSIDRIELVTASATGVFWVSKVY